MASLGVLQKSSERASSLDPENRRCQGQFQWNRLHSCRVVEFFQSSPKQCIELGVLEILRRVFLKSCILPIDRTLKQGMNHRNSHVITSDVNPSGPNTVSAALLAKGPAQIPDPDARCRLRSITAHKHRHKSRIYSIMAASKKAPQLDSYWPSVATG